MEGKWIASSVPLRSTLTIHFTTDWTVLLPERSRRKAYMEEHTGLIALPGEKKTHQEGNQIILSHKSCPSQFRKKMHQFFWRIPQPVSSCYKSLVHASGVLMLASLLPCFTGCFSSRGCDFSHRTHQSWENPSCSGSKNHSPSCSRYDKKMKMWGNCLLTANLNAFIIHA